ncbi:MAG: hypothetical protein CMN60_06170 [Sphingobium sp.]|nr:hypothetical protein [Sphingobium sp.]|tara:strand:+ start:489 stop:692 length:204 start_codon:yes stop_codon:yes gene_type:complete
MLLAISLAIGGFGLGVLLAGLGACCVVGIIYREAADMVDGYIAAAGARSSHANFPNLTAARFRHDND